MTMPAECRPNSVVGPLSRSERTFRLGGKGERGKMGDGDGAAEEMYALGLLSAPQLPVPLFHCSATDHVHGKVWPWETTWKGKQERPR